ncbi:MAG TPA: hypothetical protein PKY30_08610 [Myxococcota bacterium]|nr:hypothetical protein [Myxococcota bacterium]
MPLDPDTWTAPALPERRDASGVVGTLYGSRLYEQPRHRATKEKVDSFLSGTEPVHMEIGFDHGMLILEQARRHPEIRWLGVEIREAKVEAAARHAPPNTLLLRADARAVLAGLVPPGRLDAVIILFPSPSEKASHLLVTPALVSLLERALRPGGQVHLRSDVPGMVAVIEGAFSGWEPVEHPVFPVLSRRERVCKRDGRRVWSWSFSPRRGGAG